jgi:hypothetical protein
MAKTLLPAFVNCPNEGIRVGSILAGYGELELELCACVSAATGDLDAAIKSLFGIRGAEQRIKQANALALERYVEAGLDAPFRKVLNDLDWCRELRNQYAHCQWYYTEREGLCFVDLEETAKQVAKIESLVEYRNALPLLLLEQQEAFFVYVRRGFWYLAEAYQRWNQMRQSPHKQLRDPIFPLPNKTARPPKHGTGFLSSDSSD